MKIALDIMGGDNAPYSNILGAKLFIDATPNSNTKIIFTGPRIIIEKEIKKSSLNINPDRFKIHNANEIVTMDELKPTFAFKNKPDSSIVQAVQLVKENKSHLHYTKNDYNYKLSSSPLESLKELIDISKLPKENIEVPYPILVGYLGYPMIQYMENIKLNNPDNINIPEAILIRPKVVAVFDNIKDTISLMTLTYPNKNLSAIKAYDEAKKLLDQTVKKLQKNSVDYHFNEISFENKLDFKSNYTKQEYYTKP